MNLRFLFSLFAISCSLDASIRLPSAFQATAFV